MDTSSPLAIRPSITSAERHRALVLLNEVFDLMRGKSWEGRSLRPAEKMLEQAAARLGMPKVVAYHASKADAQSTAEARS